LAPSQAPAWEGARLNNYGAVLPMNWQAISEQIESATGQTFKVVSAHSLSGGDINSAFRLQGHDKSYFVKLNRVDLVPMFEAEFAGLRDIAKTQTICVPAPVVCGQTAEHSFIVLENLVFGCSNKASDRILGRQLALMHQQQQPYFGWHRDNTIGSTLQLNNKSGDWLVFWREQRLGF
jgi:protein-ribulosamine 3-kinase